MNQPPPSDADKAYLLEAVQLALQSVEIGGGPFGALVVQDGEVIARAANRVTLNCDPTAHAEVEAIRQAALLQASPHLPASTLYTSCEPCPMCLAAAQWARIPRIIYAASQLTADRAGFADGAMAEQLYGQAKPVWADKLGLYQMEIEQAEAPFRAWQAKQDRQNY